AFKHCCLGARLRVIGLPAAPRFCIHFEIVIRGGLPDTMTNKTILIAPSDMRNHNLAFSPTSWEFRDINDNARDIPRRPLLQTSHSTWGQCCFPGQPGCAHRMTSL